MRAVETGLLGGNVPFIRGGSGERHAVVFFGVNALFKRLDRASDPGRYARQVARLIPGHRFTILGYTGASFQEIVDNLAFAIEDPPDLLAGISFGGFAAMRFAARYPQSVRRLLLLVSAHRFSANGERMVARQMEALERKDWRRLVRENGMLFRRPWYNWLVRLSVSTVAERLAGEARDTAEILHDYRQLLGAELGDNAEYARRIACPTMMIAGTADPFFDRPAIEETASLIPNARLIFFERETHMLPLECATAVAGEIERFLSPLSTT